MQLLEEFGDNQIKTSLDLQAYKAKRKWVAQGEGAETIVLPDSDSSQHESEETATIAPIPPQENTPEDQHPKESSPQNRRQEANPDSAEAPIEETSRENTRTEEPIIKNPKASCEDKDP